MKPPRNNDDRPPRRGNGKPVRGADKSSNKSKPMMRQKALRIKADQARPVQAIKARKLALETPLNHLPSLQRKVSQGFTALASRRVRPSLSIWTPLKTIMTRYNPCPAGLDVIFQIPFETCDQLD